MSDVSNGGTELGPIQACCLPDRIEEAVVETESNVTKAAFGPPFFLMNINGPSGSSTTLFSTLHQCPASANPDPMMVGSLRPLAVPSKSIQFCVRPLTDDGSLLSA
eukprot:CAMPEP_0172570222 /NCGR_PEP_ID=MMETSP1067-20121228/126708_1 /TAXON_ID=265564 ORGANISM="Thalassiosira punctigera, Strain Tpunct2005C2" /NCGR_SAMPLE_ID=MMETSP1067 /ASSEMBLY_ACC=CAM_ASM_000444 /LENGTH=105 /DNA_ID=CAMNT_0013362273 /DNA_START=569 /DNA_END=887 /DNA_ORIENTATION=+